MSFASRILLLQATRKPNLRKYHNYSVDTLLSAENKTKTIARLLGMRPIRLQTQEPVKKAAILIPICVVDNRVSLMYVVQPSVLTDHKEKVNFPGDIKHEDDRSFADTALRASETLLGLDTSTVKIWGEGKLIVSRSDFSFIPVIGEVTGSLNLNNMNMKSDVEEIFTVPIQDLCNTKMNAYTQFKDEYSSPVFMGGKWRIWGFTAMVTNLFLKSLLATDGYAHPIQYVPSIKKGTTFPKTTRKQ